LCESNYRKNDDGISIQDIKVEGWIKQFLEHYDRPHIRFVRRTDRMTINEIFRLYNQNIIPCDSCEKNIPLTNSKLTLEQHVIHAINPRCLWTCEECLQEDIKNKRIIGIDTQNRKSF